MNVASNYFFFFSLQQVDVLIIFYYFEVLIIKNVVYYVSYIVNGFQLHFMLKRWQSKEKGIKLNP